MCACTGILSNWIRHLVLFLGPLFSLFFLFFPPLFPSEMAVERDLRNRNWWTEFGKAAMRAKASPLLLGRAAADKKGSGSSGGGGGDEEGGGLSRRLGLADLILLGIGASIGAGIFVVTGTVAHDAGPGTLQKLSNCYQFSGIFILPTGASVSGPQLQAKNFVSNSIAPGAC